MSSPQKQAYVKPYVVAKDKIWKKLTVFSELDIYFIGFLTMSVYGIAHDTIVVVFKQILIMKQLIDCPYNSIICLLLYSKLQLFGGID